MRTVMASLCVLALAACGEPPATDTAAAPAAEPSTPVEAPPVTQPATAAGQSDAAAWAKYVPWKSDNADVKKTGSGVEYVVIGSGPADGVPPKASQQATVFYEGRLNTGGGAFDSAYQRGEPATFPVGAVIPGFAEALQLMKPGDHWLVYIPSALGYGAAGAGGDIPPNSDLVFELEIVNVQ